MPPFGNRGPRPPRPVGTRLAPLEWLSAHYPFIWRTRAWFIVAAGLSYAVASGTYALGTDGRRGPTASLSSSLFVLSAWSFVSYSAALLVVIDVTRRARPIVTVAQSVRLFGCVAVSIIALTLPEYVYIKAYVPRIASLESDTSLLDMMRTYGPSDFWTCRLDEHELERLALPERDRIAADLERYGLRTDFRSGYDYAACGWRETFSMNEWTDPPTTRRAQHGLFKDRVLNVDAAKRYAKHDGAYEGVALGHFLAIVWTAVAGGVLAALLSSAMAWRWWTAISGHRKAIGGWTKWMRVSRIRPHPRFDERLAARWPALWSSRLPGATLQLLAVPGLGFFFAVMSPGEYHVAWIVLPTIVLAVFAACRSQGVARFRTTRAGLDIAVLSIHAAVLVVALAAVSWFRQVETQSEEFILTLWGIAVWCAFLQGARNGSTLTVFGALGLVGAIMFGYNAVFELTGTRLDDEAVLAGTIITMALLTAMTAFADRMEARPSLRRVLIAAVIGFSPIPVLTATIVFAVPRPDTASLTKIMIGALMALGSTCLFLVITERKRQRLSYSTR